MLRTYLLNSVKKLCDYGAFVNNRRTITHHKYFVYGEDVLAAKKNNQPIVALESTIITHGMPSPRNFDTAVKVEEIVKKHGAVPATIGIINGKIHVGMNREQLHLMSKADPKKTIKCSRRDISPIISQSLSGGTTVSATMVIANLANIPIMATGGIGGVHREAQITFDISTDLTELARTPVAVVCAGVKSILDINKTLEYLETQGVPVVKIGTIDEFPAFYCSQTFDKIKSPHIVSNSQAAANLIKLQTEIGLGTGILFVVPIPEKYALDPQEVESAINEALTKAKSMHITGKNVTPFLLQELNIVTSGQSLDANVALIENNARIAAEIAVNLYTRHQSSLACSFAANFSKENPVVAGGAIVDTILHVQESEIKFDGRTHVGRSRCSCGGVARNIANALINLGLRGTRLISVVGDDDAGRDIIESLKEAGQWVERIPNLKTARYTGILNSRGECCFGIGEMDITPLDRNIIRKYESSIQNASFVILDGNLPLDTMEAIMEIVSRANIPVWYEPTDVKKASKLFKINSDYLNVLHFVSPNKNELFTICEYLGISLLKQKCASELEEVIHMAEELACHVPVILTTLGAQGVLVTRKGSGDEPFYNSDGNLIENNIITSRLYPAVQFDSKEKQKKLNVIGCGDCLSAGVICGIHQHLSEARCMALALKAANLSLKSLDAVPSTLSSLNNADSNI